MGRCSRCGAGKPESSVHKWCAKCCRRAAGAQQDKCCTRDSKPERCRMAELATSTSSSEQCTSLEAFTYSPDVGGGEVQVGPRDEEPTLKQCALCKNYKPVDDFYQSKSSAMGNNKDANLVAIFITAKSARMVATTRRRTRMHLKTKSRYGSAAKGMTYTSSRTVAFQNTRSEGRPTLRRAAMGWRHRRTFTY